MMCQMLFICIAGIHKKIEMKITYADCKRKMFVPLSLTKDSEYLHLVNRSVRFQLSKFEIYKNKTRHSDNYFHSQQTNILK